MPFVLQPRRGLSLLIGWLLCCVLRPATGLAIPAIDTPHFRIELLPTTATGPVKIGVGADLKVPINIRIEWQILQNGLPGQKGALPSVMLIPGHPAILRLPLKLPTGTDQVGLKVTCHYRTALYVRLLPLRAWRGDPTIPPAGDLNFTDSGNTFTIAAPNTLIQFDKQTGWLLHYEAGGVRLMTDTAGVQPALWPSIPPRLQLFSTSTGTQLVIVRAEYTLPETASLLHLSYTINAAGAMLVGQTLEPDTSQQVPDTVRLPPLTGFGMHWLLPPGLDTLTWFGSPQKAGPASTATAGPTTTDSAPPAISQTALTPATGSREDSYSAVRWLTITGHQGTGLRITADSALITATLSAVDSSNDPKRMLLNIGTLPAPATTGRANGQYSYKVTPVLPPTPTVPRPTSPRIHQ